MISPFLTKIAALRKWIYLGAAAWTFALVFIARGTGHLRQHTQSALEPRSGLPENNARDELAALRQENGRLQNELEKLPELSARAAQLKKKFSPGENANGDLWTAQSNSIQSAIEQQKRALAEVYQWSSEWHKAKQREEAQARLAERASDVSADPDKEYARTTEMLRNLALAQKRLSEVRREWTKLDKSEKDQFRPRLEQAQAEWWAADQKVGKDRVLYQAMPLTNLQDPSSVVFLRSIIPDQNGTLVTVYLDGTVQFSKQR